MNSFHLHGILCLPLNRNFSFITPNIAFLIAELALSTSLMITMSASAIGVLSSYLFSVNRVCRSGIPLISDALVPSSVSRIYILLAKSSAVILPSLFNHALAYSIIVLVLATPGSPTSNSGNPVASANASILNTSSLLIKEVSMFLTSCVVFFVIVFVALAILRGFSFVMSIVGLDTSSNDSSPINPS